MATRSSSARKSTSKAKVAAKVADDVVVPAKKTTAPVAANPADNPANPADNPAEDLLGNLLPWDKLAAGWNAKAPAWFPAFMGTSIPTFATFIFLHSFILTIITPAMRYVSGTWWGLVPSTFFINLFSEWIGRPLNWALGGPNWVTGVNYKIDNKPMGPSNTQAMDNTWVAHATAGMMWLTVSWIQIVIIPKYFPKWHRRTGPAVLMVLFIHLGCAFNILIHDQQKQNTLNKVALSSLPFIATVYAMVGAFKAVMYLLSGEKTQSLINDHKDRMIVGWLWSISGAGPIRIVAAVTEPFGYGPLGCMEKHGSEATECLWPYFNRLLMVATWNLLMTGIYCKIRGNQKLTTTWVKNVFCHLIVCASFGLLGFLPGSAAFVNGITGGAANDISWIVTYVLWVAQALQLTIFFPLLFVLLSFAGPGMLFAYTVSAFMF